MDRHEENQLMQHIEQVWLEGSTYVRWDKLYLWYDTQKISKKPWRDIHSRWTGFCVDRGYEDGPALTILETPHGAAIRRDFFDGEKNFKLPIDE